MRRLATTALATVLILAVAGPASAGQHAGRGFVPPNAKVHGYSLKELSTAWNVWALGSPEAVNPLVANRCEQSPIDKKIWFMPVSLGGDYEVDCRVPSGAFLVVTPGGWFCDVAEAGGSTNAELRSVRRQRLRAPDQGRGRPRWTVGETPRPVHRDVSALRAARTKPVDRGSDVRRWTRAFSSWSSH